MLTNKDLLRRLSAIPFGVAVFALWGYFVVFINVFGSGRYASSSLHYWFALSVLSFVPPLILLWIFDYLSLLGLYIIAMLASLLLEDQYGWDHKLETIFLGSVLILATTSVHLTKLHKRKKKFLNWRQRVYWVLFIAAGITSGYMQMIANEPPEFVLNALHDTAISSFDDGEKMRLLISEGAIVDRKDNNGMTALHYSTKFKHPETTRALIAGGADVNLTDEFGNSPLHFALHKGIGTDTPEAIPPTVAIVKMLLLAGADLNVTNNLGKLPEGLAIENWGGTEIPAMFEKK